MKPPSFAEFTDLAAQGNVIPMAESLLADLLTPVSAFLKLCGEDEQGFLLESVEGGEKVARYSFLGRKPSERIQFDGTQVMVSSERGQERIETDIFTYLKSRIQGYRFVQNPELPYFSGGIVGYFGYDTVRLLEVLPESNPPLPETPWASFGVYDTVLAFDHLQQRILIITNAFLDEHTDLRTSYHAALQRIAEVKALLRKPLVVRESVLEQLASQIQSNVTREAFCEAVEQAKEYIRAGDIFQVVLSQRFSCPIAVPPFNIYRALRMLNPSPYLFCVRQGQRTIIGSSPELLVNVRGGEVVVRPIAGTRPRGSTPREDREFEMDLLADEKELAEHVMLVDLARNDVGRVSNFGEVRLTEKMIIERYSHVMHIVSEVRGMLRPELDAIDAFKACFPAGTLSGAPKVRAMEIIEELEPERRGIYGGGLGFLDFSGNLETCIVIRTLEITDSIASFQVGAGIVADSDPDREFEETVHKSNAIRAAITLAEHGLEQ
ncbi:anthranilate synthase component I [candidate division KSB3 bacterium]|uniref:Anthranilate synthase component 1 n=1 Tax=candidate division KSB3 bacterium TaxID=2044937 RepID=A0A9D5JY23_9BACT|nr:anthranilate synthase component I [candidate division KSB3 bacterium]MBD3326283.1 anthranilate synthase component I [candidate division KSB3 bacterium]